MPCVKQWHFGFKRSGRSSRLEVDGIWTFSEVRLLRGGLRIRKGNASGQKTENRKRP